MVHLNKGRGRLMGDVSINQLDRNKLEWLMPYDMWVYNYATDLLYAKWKYYEDGFYQKPKRPPYPRYEYFSLLTLILYLPCIGDILIFIKKRPRKGR